MNEQHEQDKSKVSDQTERPAVTIQFFKRDSPTLEVKQLLVRSTAYRAHSS